MHTSYLGPAFNELPKIAEYVNKVMNELNAEVVVGRGLSGMLVAAAVNALYGKKYAVVRKEDEFNHSLYEVESSFPRTINGKHGNWIIVDDLIASGHTVRSIIEEVIACGDFKGDCVGIVLYFDEGHNGDFKGIPLYDYQTWRKENENESKAAKAKPYGKRFFQGSKRKGYFSAMRSPQNAKNNKVYR